MPVEGRGLSSRPTQDVVRDLEIGQPSNSETCSETTDGVTRESEGGGRLSLLRPVRQDQPRRHPGSCLCPVPLQQGRTGCGRSRFCGHRGVWGRLPTITVQADTAPGLEAATVVKALSTDVTAFRSSLPAG